MAYKLKIEFLLLKGEDTKCNSIVTLKNLLSSDGEVSFKRQSIKVGKAESSFKVSTNLVQDGNKERYFLISLEKNRDSKNENKQVDELIDVFRKIKQIISDSGKAFKIAPLWDDTAFYFSRLSYPHIYEVENLMRQLIYKFMYTKLGSSWFKNAIPDEFKAQINRKDREVSNAYIEASLYNADFIHVINFLFGKYTVDTNKTFEKIKGAKKISELTLQELKQVVPEDNWSRYFQPIIAFDKFKEKWEKLYELRCKVAHNTLLTKGDYEEILKLCKEFKEKIEKAISSIAGIIVLEKDKAELSQSAISSFSDTLSKALNVYNINSEILENRFVGLNSNLSNAFSKLPNLITSDTNRIYTALSGLSSELLSNQFITSNSLKTYLFPNKKCAVCGKTYTPKEITLSTSPGVCEDCQKPGGVFLATQ